MDFILTTICVALALTLFLSWRAQLAHRKLLKEAHKLERQTLEQQIKDLEKEHKLLLNAFDDALLITDSKGIIHLANLSAKQLCNRNKLKGKTITQAFLNEPITEAIKLAISKNAPSRQTLILPSRSFGSTSSFEESSWILDTAPLQIKDSEHLFRVVLRDVTAEYKADQIKREFVANASHELRTPLSIINGYLENLQEEGMLDNPAMVSKFLGTMQKHGQRLSELIEGMLSISKLETGDSTLLNIEEFSISEMLHDIKERLLPMTRDNNATITIESDDFTVKADRFYWEQIFFNLTENALKQNANSSIKVTLRAKATDTGYEFSVSDTGKGIPSDHLPFIFNRFYRVQKHHSQNEVKGTGLGLAIVKHAVELHGGSISASSTPHIDTTFSIELPN